MFLSHGKEIQKQAVQGWHGTPQCRDHGSFCLFSLPSSIQYAAQAAAATSTFQPAGGGEEPTSQKMHTVLLRTTH